MWGSSNFTTKFEIQLKGVKQADFVNFVNYHKLNTEYSPTHGIIMLYTKDSNKALTGPELLAL